MIIREKNQDTVKYHDLTGTEIALGNGDFRVDLAKYQQDYPVHIDISEDEKGKLVTGPAHRYMAEIDIPARTYEITAGAKDDLGFPLLTKTALPLDTEKVTLTLWEVQG
jgi:hypothetical protein